MSNVLKFPGASRGVNTREMSPHDELVSKALHYWGFRPDFLVVASDTSVTSLLPFLSADYSYLGERHLLYGYKFGEQHHVGADLRAHATVKAMRECFEEPTLYKLDDAYEFYEVVPEEEEMPA